MTVQEMYVKCKEIYEEIKDEYYFVGIRFEDKEREVGEVITDKSRHNTDREDEREFPEYGTEEYEEMIELDGVSAWNMVSDINYKPNSYNANREAEKVYFTKHCYIIVSDDAVSGSDLELDHNEIVLRNAKVIAKLF